MHCSNLIELDRLSQKKCVQWYIVVNVYVCHVIVIFTIWTGYHRTDKEISEGILLIFVQINEFLVKLLKNCADLGDLSVQIIEGILQLRELVII